MVSVTQRLQPFCDSLGVRVGVNSQFVGMTNRQVFACNVRSLFVTTHSREANSLPQCSPLSCPLPQGLVQQSQTGDSHHHLLGSQCSLNPKPHKALA